MDLLLHESFDLGEDTTTYSDVNDFSENTGWAEHTNVSSFSLTKTSFDEGTGVLFWTIRRLRTNEFWVLYNEDIGDIKSSRSEFVISKQITGSYTGPVVRFNPETESFYMMAYETGRSELFIFKVIGGVPEELAKKQIEEIDEPKLSLHIDGSSLRVLANDRAILNARDNDLKYGYAGIGMIGTRRPNTFGAADLNIWYRSPKYIGKVS